LRIFGISVAGRLEASFINWDHLVNSMRRKQPQLKSVLHAGDQQNWFPDQELPLKGFNAMASLLTASRKFT
jgi:hypothetical protein